MGHCSDLIDEWNPAHRRTEDGMLAAATDYGGEGRINPAWSMSFVDRLMHNGRNGMVELSYPSWLSFLNRSASRGRLVADSAAFWPNLHEVEAQPDLVRGRSLGRFRRTRASADSAARRFVTDVQTVVELFKALAAWRVPDQVSTLYERHGVQCTPWAYSVACVSCPTIWIVTDPELPLTLISDRPGLYEALETQRRLRPESNSTAIVRNAQQMTIDECIAALYSGRDIDWMP